MSAICFIPYKDKSTGRKVIDLSPLSLKPIILHITALYYIEGMFLNSLIQSFTPIKAILFHNLTVTAPEEGLI